MYQSVDTGYSGALHPDDGPAPSSGTGFRARPGFHQVPSDQWIDIDEDAKVEHSREHLLLSANHREDFVDMGQDGRGAWSWRPSSFSGDELLRTVCVGLHVLLVVMHVVLLAVWGVGSEHRVVVPLLRSEIISTIMVSVSQVFVTLYTAALVVTTQILAIKRTLLKHQTLTATHDEATAWTGLGSALLSLYRQTHVAATVTGTLAITAYLGLVGVLHISTPALFALQPFNASKMAVVRTTRGMPNITFDTTNAFEQNIFTPFEFWSTTTPLLPYFDRITEPPIGVSNATLYDQLDDNDGVGTTSVGGTAFNVTCGALTSMSAVGASTTTTDMAEGNYTTTWRILANAGDYNVTFDVPIIAPNIIRQVTYKDVYDALFQDNSSTSIFPSRNNIFYMSVNLTDSSGSTGSVVTPQPLMVPIPNGPDVHPGSTEVYGLQVVGCTLSLFPQSVDVDVHSKRLLSASPPAEKTASAWTTWEPEGDRASKEGIGDTYWPWVQNASVDAWGDMLQASPTGSVVTSLNCNNASSSASCDNTRYTEEFLMNRLGLVPEYWDNRYNLTTPPTLHQFENALGSMAASMYWAAAHIPIDNVANLTSWSSTPASQALLTEGQTSVSMTASRLNLNAAMIAIGLGSSLILLAIAIVVTRRPRGARASVDAIGMLQTIWLIRQRPELQHLVSQVDEPTVESLRRAGMVGVRIGVEEKDGLRMQNGRDGGTGMVRIRRAGGSLGSFG